MIVLKFGGTSVQNSEWIDKAIDIAEAQIESAPLMISSAMGKTTDMACRNCRLCSRQK